MLKMNFFTRLFKDFPDYQNTFFPEQLFMAHSWQRVPLSLSILWRSSYILLKPPFCVLFLWLDGCSYHIWCVVSFNDIMDLDMSSVGTLVPDDLPWFTSCVKCIEIWHMRYFAGTLIWYHTHKYTHTHKDTQHTPVPIDWHIHININ